MTTSPVSPPNPQARRGSGAGRRIPRPSEAGPRSESEHTDAASPAPAQAPKARTTRAGMVWAAVIVALLALILLIVFILQNQQPARVFFLGLDGTVALGIALLMAAVGGGVLVAAAGGARIIQLRSNARRARKENAPRSTNA